MARFPINYASELPPAQGQSAKFSQLPSSGAEAIGGAVANLGGAVFDIDQKIQHAQNTMTLSERNSQRDIANATYLDELSKLTDKDAQEKLYQEHTAKMATFAEKDRPEVQAAYKEGLTKTSAALFQDSRNTGRKAIIDDAKFKFEHEYAAAAAEGNQAKMYQLLQSASDPNVDLINRNGSRYAYEVANVPTTAALAQAETQVLSGDITTIKAGNEKLKQLQYQSNWRPNAQDLRADGTQKGRGWLGVLPTPDGGVTSEYSVGVEINGKETEIPSLIKGLSDEQVKLMTTDIIPNHKQVPDDIMKIAVDSAKKRISDGKSPFATESDSPPIKSGLTIPQLEQVRKLEKIAKQETSKSSDQIQNELILSLDKNKSLPVDQRMSMATQARNQIGQLSGAITPSETENLLRQVAHFEDGTDRPNDSVKYVDLVKDVQQFKAGIGNPTELRQKIRDSRGSLDDSHFESLSKMFEEEIPAHQAQDMNKLRQIAIPQIAPRLSFLERLLSLPEPTTDAEKEARNNSVAQATEAAKQDSANLAIYMNQVDDARKKNPNMDVYSEGLKILSKSYPTKETERIYKSLGQKDSSTATPKTKEEYDSLPSGTIWMDDKGVMRKKK